MRRSALVTNGHSNTSLGNNEGGLLNVEYNAGGLYLSGWAASIEVAQDSLAERR